MDEAEIAAPRRSSASGRLAGGRAFWHGTGMAIQEGKAAPDFTLSDQDGKPVTLSDFQGKRAVLLYFYPKDDTPGCTKEACGFRDGIRAFAKLGVAVLGVSPDGAASHQKFIAKYKLPFPLLSDPDRKVMKKYGAFGEKVMYGKKTQGVIRSSVLIGKDGKVLRHWARVAKAEAHPDQALELVQELLG
jgi:peroxiredoxin Q/BCP